MTRRSRLAVGFLAWALPAVALTAGTARADEAGPTVTPTATFTATGTPTATVTSAARPFTVDDAVLRWGVNQESNTKAFAPGTYNFLAAGAVPDPGRGGQQIVAPGTWQGTHTTAWRSRSGHATLEKQRPDGAWARATFSGLSTTVAGDPIPATTGPFSGHRIVLDGGVGTVDPAAGTASVHWAGSFSIVYYSGYTFVVVSDPTLTVTPAAATLTATLSGYAADRADPDSWEPVAPKRVRLADLPRDAVVLPVDADGTGFSAAPAYAGVTYAPAGSLQVHRGDDWGSFPTSFVDYAARLGSGAFWYSSGGEADARKVPAVLDVAFADADTPPVPAPTTAGPVASATVAPTPTTSSLPTPPALPAGPSRAPVATGDRTAPTPITRVAASVPAAAAAPSEPPSATPAAARAATAAVSLAAPPAPVYALSADQPVQGEPLPTPAGPVWAWALGSFLILAALALLRTCLPVPRRKP